MRTKNILNLLFFGNGFVGENNLARKAIYKVYVIELLYALRAPPTLPEKGLPFS